MKLVTTAVLAGALALGATACGGSSGGSSSTSTTTTTTASTTAPTTTVSGGGGKGGRLSAADWAAFQQDAAQAKSVNQQGIKTFKKCRKEISASYSETQIAACFGTTTAKVVAAGQTLLTQLRGYQAKAGGACAAALGNTGSDVTLYVSSVNALNLSAQGGNVPPIQSVDTALAQLAKAQAAAKAITPACQPQ